MDIRKRSSSLKNNRTISAVLFCCLFLIASFNVKNEKEFSNKLNGIVTQNIERATIHLDSIAYFLKQNNRPEAVKQYEASRKAFKHIEFYIEYHFPFYSKYFVNSALVNKAEYEYGYKTFAPHGYQVIESYLYEGDATIQIKYELDLLKQTFRSISDRSNKLNKESTTVDMIRFEIVRIMALYLNGYDCTVNKQNLKETMYILEGIEKMILLFNSDEKIKTEILQAIKGSRNYISKNTDYDSFDRLYFITTHLKPIYEKLYKLYTPDETHENTFYGINIRKQKFYDEQWLNVKFFSVVLGDSVDVNEQAALGKLLFFDPILSGNNQRACASCHKPNNAFGGNTDLDLDFDSQSKLKRNTPSLINTLFQKSFFHDGRALQLEDQVSDVLFNHKEMNAAPDEIVKKLRLSSEYKIYFKKAFKNTEDTTITYYAVLKCIAEFERKLISFNSRFDKYVRGDAKQLSKDEIKGYTIFAGKALCGSCHFFPLFNGLTPPFYADNEFEVIGTPRTKSYRELSMDSGRYHVSKNAIHLNAIKTPGIRNIDKTAPYMHNGVFTTVDEIIEFYKKGGGAGLGLNVENQTLPFDSLDLNKKEIEQLKKFLLCLSDHSFDAKPPNKLPYIKGCEKRKIGGEY